MRLDGRVALVTGAAQGIGKAIALELARCGAAVAFCDLDLPAAEATLSELQAAGHRVLFCPADVSKETDVAHLVETTHEAFGRIDILVNNAAIGPKRKFSELDLKLWNHVLAVDLTGVFLCCKAVVPIMLEQGYGRIISFSSASVLTGSGAGAAYCAAKAGVYGLTRALARELAPSGIVVNAIAPRTIETPMLTAIYSPEQREELAKSIPLGRLGQPEDIARWVAFLASDYCGFMCGETILLDGGRTYLS